MESDEFSDVAFSGGGWLEREPLDNSHRADTRFDSGLPVW